MAACANTVALRTREMEQTRRSRIAAGWAKAFEHALRRFPEEFGDDILLEVVSELGEEDPDFDHDLALAFRRLSNLRARRADSAHLNACYLAIGQTIVEWIDHYGARWAEREADSELGL